MGDTQPLRKHEPRATSARPWAWLLIFPAILLVVVVVATATGYLAGAAEASQRSTQDSARASQEQFDLGVQDLLAARYELARRRFEYILSIDPTYPGAAELLAQALQALNVPTSTPSPSPVPSTPTATLDVSSLDGLFAQAQSSFGQGDWSGTLHALLAMRAEDPQYRLAEVNALMGITLRNRGVEKILQGFLEQGIYDLALAERFGALDAQAIAWRNSAQFYLIANSYIGVNWPQAAEYFRQICSAQTWDACSKYALAAMKYGDLLLATQDVCGAMFQYQSSLNAMFNAALGPTATSAADRCLTATAATPTSTPAIGTPTPTSTLETPVATTEAPSETPTATPTETPTEAPAPLP